LDSDHTSIALHFSPSREVELFGIESPLLGIGYASGIIKENEGLLID